ncbi:hypothetical protein GCM10010425_11250 [Streptomyces spororaveus]|uniref:Uncharacterized protein n=1 Tax=Streptomyces spororaveus TaxID=284039 RepID=A0ABQ3TN15_9ACTN|nr:hypothetical protein Sspor_73660 [Streptomyces spororaveus]
MEGEPDHRHPGLRLAALEGREDDIRPVHPEEVRASPPVRTVRTACRTRGRARSVGPGFADPAHDGA